MTATAATREVERRFGAIAAVSGVTLEVAPGEIVGLLGANGAGKTTLIRMLLGLLAPTGGSVELFGRPPSRESRRRLGYLPQSGGLYDDLSVMENLAFVSGVYGVPAPDLGHLEAVRSRMVADLPLGIRRQVGFLAALCHHPELLVLDEPTSGVGPLARAQLWDTIHAAADSGVAVLVTTHHMDEAEQCDRLVMLSDGVEVASGSVEAVVAGMTSLEFGPSNPAAAMTALEDSGFCVFPVGHGLRVPDASAADIRLVLGEPEMAVATRPATLEESFAVLSSSKRAG